MNPYQYDRFLSAMLAVPERFIGPREELEELLVRVSDERPAAVLLVGPWGVGKSFLLQILAQNRASLYDAFPLFAPRFQQAPERIRFVLAAFGAPPMGAPADRLFARVLWERLDAVLSDPAEGAAPSLFSTAIAQFLEALPASRRANPNGALLLELLDQLDREGLRVVLMVDDFDALGPRLQLDDYNMLWGLVHRASMVITSSQPLSRLAPVSSMISPFFSLLHQLDRTRSVLNMFFFLSQDDAMRLVLEPPTWSAATAGFRFSPRDAQFVIRLVGQHADFVRLSCEEIYEWHQRVGYHEGPDRIPSAAQPIVRVRLRQALDLSFQLLWRRLDAEEQTALAAVALGEEVDHVGASHSAFARLVERSYLVYREGRVQPFAELFTEYVLEQNAHDGTGTRAIRWIEELGPTTLERRLVTLLLNAPERMLTHGDLVRLLYPDAREAGLDELKSRLEVLISRLRVKLRSSDLRGYEIESVRGKGYRLTLPS